MTTGSSSKTGPTHKLVEAGITLLITLFGVIVIIGSVKAGINWGAEGPRAGFFPFYIGIFIGWFMRWLGKYSWLVVTAVALGMPIVTYLIFERWFLVPLPKGPVEEWLGL